MREAHAQIGKRTDDQRAETREAHAQIGKRIDDTNARISDLRADFRTVFPRAAAERPGQ